MKLEEIYRPIEADLAQVQRTLGFEMERVVNNVSGDQAGARSKYDIFTAKAINYLLSKPGKHLRPALVLLSAGSLGVVKSEALLRMAAAIELIHSASLVHDDIIDEAERRRNYLSAHRKYGVKIAVLIGDSLFAHSFALISTLPAVDSATIVRIYEILTDLSRRMCYGEIFEQRILDSGDPVAKDSYLRILEFKTALLMSAACRCGAILAGADGKQEEALASYGLNFGYAYQLVDDFKDGDSIFSGDLDLMSLASDYIQAARSGLGVLPDSEFATSLSNFAGFILSAR